MQRCNYAEQLGCKKCTQVFYQKCEKFRKSYYKDLVSEILPVQYQKPKCVAPDRNHVWCSKNERAAKSLATYFACSLKKRIKRLTVNQAITIVLANEEFQYEMVYLDCKNARVDLDKVLNCVVSFVDKCILQQIPIVVSLQGSNIAPNQDWKQC